MVAHRIEGQEDSLASLVPGMWEEAHSREGGHGVGEAPGVEGPGEGVLHLVGRKLDSHVVQAVPEEVPHAQRDRHDLAEDLRVLPFDLVVALLEGVPALEGGLA